MWSQVNFIFLSVCVFAGVKNSLQRSSPASSHYRAAVVEYNPYNTGNDTEVFQKNAEIYESLIGEAAAPPNNVDIIVFPECGLATLNRRVYSQVPSPTTRVSPCDDRSGKFDNLRTISCAAKEKGVYVVINLYEIQPCTNETTSDYGEPCPLKKQAFFYNTNIVFDRSGTVISRYRKFNLFGEIGIGIPPKADVVTFDTDFGVTFGMFTCFDIMFEKPAVQLIREKHVSDVIFPTAWFSELPFLTAVQAQTAWAYGMNVNFLGAGYNEPRVGSGGSGIYAGRSGPLKFVMPSSPSTHLLVGELSKIPKVSPQQEWDIDVNSTDGMYMKQENLTQYETHLLNLSDGMTLKKVVCHGEFCCSFEVSGKRAEKDAEGVSYTYRLAVFNGVRSFDHVANGGMQVCAVIACTDTSVSSCGTAFPREQHVIPTEFRLIRVRGEFKKAGTQLANTVTDNYQPLPADNYVMLWLPLDEDDLVTAEMILVKDASPLTFGIYGRDFARDSGKETNMAAVTMVGLTPLLYPTFQTLYTVL